MAQTLKKLTLGLLLAGLLIGCGTLQPEKPRGPAGEILDKRQLESVGGATKNAPNHKIKDVTYNFTDGLFVMKIEAKRVMTCNHEVEAEKKPYRLTIRAKSGTDKTKVVHEFEIDGDTLKLGTGDKQEVLKRVAD